MKLKKSSLAVLAAVFIFAACSESKNNDEFVPDSDQADDSSVEDFDDEAPDEDGETEKSDSEDPEHGITFGDRAADFTLQLDSGDWNFEENYSENENYLFVFYRSTSSTSKKIWGTKLYDTFDRAPENIHFFFLADTDDAETAGEKIKIMKEVVEDAYYMVGNSEILKRIHFVSKALPVEGTWIADLLKDNKSEFFFGIDRFRRIRRGGSFSSWNSSTLPPELDNVYKEAEFYDYEKKMSDFIDEHKSDSTVFKGLDSVPFAEEGWTKTLDFSINFEGLSENGELFISLEQLCENPKSCEWDRLERLFLCDETGEKCETEIGRWITTYGRSGKWLTDITPLKPLFEKDGKYKFRFTVDGDYYVNNLDFIFIKKDENTPKDLLPLFNQREQFDENYNSHFEPVKTEISGNIKKAEIYAYITGHGQSSEEANCAEFCQFESVFTVNGTDFEIDFDNAGTSDGCFEEVRNGVVPNQYGSWPYGRSGWCPGQNVRLIKIDVTDALASGENTFSYSAYLDGKIYEPVVTDESGYRAEIYLSSYLVIYE